MSTDQTGTDTDIPTPTPSTLSPTSDSPVAAGRDPKWWTLGAVCLGTFMLLLDITIVNVALPDIQNSLHSSFSDLQWVVDAYALTLASLLLTSGSLADMFGRRRLYLVGLAIFTAASALCGAAQSSVMLELSRGLQGVGGAMVFSVSLALLAHAFRGPERGAAFGIWGAVTGIAVSVGPIVGGALVTGLSWRWIFFVNVPFGIVAIALTFMRVQESRDSNARRPDWLGFVLFTAGLASLIYGLIESGRVGFSSGRVIGCFLAAGALLIGFVVTESRGKQPMFDLSLFRLPTFSGGALAAFGVSGGIFSLLLYLTLYLQDILRYSALDTGLRLLVLSGGILSVSTVAGRLTSRVPIRLLISPGLLLVGLGLMLMRGLDASSSWTHLIAGMIIGGVGVGLLNPPLASTAVGVVEPHRAGMASGINSTFRQIGIATGIALLGTLFANRIGSAVASATAGTGFAHQSSAISAALRAGAANSLFAHVSSPQQATQLGEIVRGSFTTALDEILLVGAILSFVAGVLTFFLIRTKDFVQHVPGQPTAAGGH